MSEHWRKRSDRDGVKGGNGNPSFSRDHNRVPTTDIQPWTTQRYGRQARKPRQSGRNSYLKVVLDDQTMNELHRLSLQLQQDVRERQHLAVGTDSVAARTQPVASYKMALAYRSRSRSSLHMTFFFGGETLCALPADEIRQWHDLVTERLHSAGFRLAGNCISDRQTDIVQDNARLQQQEQERHVNQPEAGELALFRVTHLQLFPPHRKNLVVAILEDASQGGSWQRLYTDMRNIAKHQTFSRDLAQVTKVSKDRWICHVTLGDIRGGNKSDVRQLAEYLRVKYSNLMLTANTTAIAMGGPIPQQTNLGFDYVYHQPRGEGTVVGHSPTPSAVANGADTSADAMARAEAGTHKTTDT